jgi:hypothetical protein
MSLGAVDGTSIGYVDGVTLGEADGTSIGDVDGVSLGDVDGASVGQFIEVFGSPFVFVDGETTHTSDPGHFCREPELPPVPSSKTPISIDTALCAGPFTAVKGIPSYDIKSTTVPLISTNAIPSGKLLLVLIPFWMVFPGVGKLMTVYRFPLVGVEGGNSAEVIIVLL